MVPKQILDQTLLTHIAKHSSSVVLGFDDNLRILTANAAAEGLLGDNVVGRMLSDVFVDFNRSLTAESLKSEEMKSRILTLDTPKQQPVSMIFSFYYNEGGFVAIGEADAEEAKKLRDSLLDINRELSNVSRELFQKNAELERLNNLKDEFMGIAAHDLRSPIAAIQTYADLLRNKQHPINPEASDKFLNTIHSLSEFMMVLISEILDITAFETGKVRLDREQFKVSDILLTVVEIYGTIAAHHNIRLVFNDLSFNEREANIDAFKMRQVFENIINNAIKYSPDDTAISIFFDQTPNKTIIHISDEGKGIPDGELENIFKPFSRASVPVRKEDKSSGLGLSICKRIVEAHGGTVYAENNSEVGSTFTIEIPTPQRGA